MANTGLGNQDPEGIGSEEHPYRTRVSSPDPLPQSAFTDVRVPKAAEAEEDASNRWIATRDTILGHLLSAYSDESRRERDLRETYAHRFLWLFFGEAAAAFMMMALMGAGMLSIPQWVAVIFFTAVFGHTTILVLKIVGYLFKEHSDKLLGLAIERFFGSQPRSDTRSPYRSESDE